MFLTIGIDGLISNFRTFSSVASSLARFEALPVPNGYALIPSWIDLKSKLLTGLIGLLTEICYHNAKNCSQQ